MTRSGRGRQASKKNLADDFVDIEHDVQTTYGNGFVMSEKKRRVTAVERTATKLKGLVRRTEEAEPPPRPSGRERSRTVIGDKMIREGRSAIVPVIE